jgi:peptide-methionine (S)-S-oxide reductase
VCGGTTGHAEVTQITFDPDIISYDELLEVFWQTHDPTTLNRQGNDVGSQYRSAIYYHDEVQKQQAEKTKEILEQAKVWPNSIVTEISQLGEFYPAEDYHQNYFNENGNQPYCQFVIRPKVEKFENAFRDKLRE